MYPVMINIREKKVVVVGGGKVAARKIKTLLTEQAAVTVVSPTLHADIPQAEVQWLARSYQTGDLEGAKAGLCLYRSGGSQPSDYGGGGTQSAGEQYGRQDLF